MSRIAALATLLLLLVGGGPGASAADCGRPGYPDTANFNAASVRVASLWDSLVARGGFGGGPEARGEVAVTVPDGGRVYEVTLGEVVVRDYTGGGAINVTAIALRVTERTTGGPVTAIHNFTLHDFGGRAGGNLTLVAWIDSGQVQIFWRWAYLLCAEDFPNLYYVFAASANGGADGGVVRDNTLVYFEAPRPRRAPPTDLIVLVVGGASASAIFLLARRALKKGSPPPDAGERTIK